MKIFKQLTIILLFSFIGEAVSRFLLPMVPGSVIGLVLLLVALLSKIVKIEQVEETANFMVGNLAFFFIPPGVALISSFVFIKNAILEIMSITVISTVFTMTIAGLLVQAAAKGESKNEKKIK